MSLNGASSLEKSKLRLQWKSNEDCKSSNSSDFQDKNSLKGVALSPQSIRTFIIDYNEPVRNITKQEAKKVRPVDKVLKRAAERRVVDENKKQNTEKKEETKVVNKTEPVVKAPEAVNATEPAKPKAKQVNIILDLTGKKDEPAKESVKES